MFGDITTEVVVKLLFSPWFWLTLLTVYLVASNLFMLYLAYAAYDSAKRRGESPPLTSKLLAGPPLAVAALIDVVFLNMIVGTIIFLELPIMSGSFEDRTFTNRIRIHKVKVIGWRGVVARYIARQLDWAVPGTHT